MNIKLFLMSIALATVILLILITAYILTQLHPWFGFLLFLFMLSGGIYVGAQEKASQEKIDKQKIE